MVIVVRLHGEAVSLLVDSIADVVDVDADDFEAPPDTLERAAPDLIRGAYKLDGRCCSPSTSSRPSRPDPHLLSPNPPPTRTGGRQHRTQQSP